ncbi:DUF1552 domain-containing protein [soil metagenome]
MSVFNRRSLMRGMLGGGAVVMGIPTLDLFLDGNGKAYADGARLPTRFGMFFWSLGLTPLPNGDSRWVPKKTGPGYEITTELESLRGLEKKVSVMSGFNVLLDGSPNLVHYTGQAGILAGKAPVDTSNGFSGPSFDTAVADFMGGGTRFRSIEMSSQATNRRSFSTRDGRNFSTPDTSPMQLYTRLFGEGFQDPNSDNFKPDPQVMLRRSVLSAVTDQRQALLSRVGADDKHRLDQYFTSVREMEDQLAIELQKPAKCESCVVPSRPSEKPASSDITVINTNNAIMAKLTAMALACNQTKIFHAAHSDAASTAYLPGDSQQYHLHTHDEPVDQALGYQPISAKLAGLSFKGYAEYLRAMDEIKEGDGTLLDHSLVMAYTDTGFAKIHSVDNIPVFFAGGANGAHKTGQHIQAKGDAISRVSLTAQQLLKLPVGEFGMGAMKTNKTITELVA